MGLFNSFFNNIKAVVGKDQEFLQLLQSGDISRAISHMNDNSAIVNKAIKEYNTETHEVMNREDKKITDKDGRFIRYEPQWKLPIPYPSYINEIALVMLLGRPVKWKQRSNGTDEAYTKVMDLVKSTRFDSRIRQCKRLAGKETESALLYHCYRKKNGERDLLLKVLARSLGDDIKTMFDQYDRLIAFGRGYYLKEGRNVIYHFDIFTHDLIYKCKKGQIGWDITEEENLLGKIPVVYFKQDTEHKGVEPLIKREEWVGSTTADVNDYFASPAVVIDSDVIESLPEKGEVGKLYVKSGDSTRLGISYLTYDAAPEAKIKEIEWLQYHIHSKTFTPKIDWESAKGLGNISGKALEQLFLPATIKVEKNKEVYGESIDRAGSLFIACVANVLEIRLKSECDKLLLGHEFQKPFAEDILDLVSGLTKIKDAGGMSQETLVEHNPYVDDTVKELDRIKNEEAAKVEANRVVDIFEAARV